VIIDPTRIRLYRRRWNMMDGTPNKGKLDQEYVWIAHLGDSTTDEFSQAHKNLVAGATTPTRAVEALMSLVDAHNERVRHSL
jgi:hypothetical protein